MSLTSTIMNIGLFMTVAAVLIVIYVSIKYRKGELTEKPGDLQFSYLDNMPGDGYVDLNVVKAGKTETLESMGSSGYISWEAYFHPKTSEDMEKRLPATIAVITIFAVGIVITAVMKLMEIQAGYYFGLGYLFLASALVLIKFIEYNIIKK